MQTNILKDHHINMRLSHLEQQVLNELIAAGRTGILGRDLVDSTWRFGAVIFTLRGHGYLIKSTRISVKTWRYTLQSKLPTQGDLFNQL